MMWSLVTKYESEYDLNSLPESVRQEAVRAILELKHDPFPDGFVKLTGYYDWYRIRFYRNKYRVVYQVSTKNRRIIVHRVGHRENVYRGMVHNPDAPVVIRRRVRLHPRLIPA